MTKIGILGAGQLASMLSVEAQQLGLEIHIFAFSSDDPALKVADHGFVSNHGSRYHHDDLRDFLSQVDLAIFENELLTDEDYQFVTNVLKTPVFPNVDCMKLCSDKSKQKELFTEISVASARYLNFQPTNEIEQVWKQLKKAFSKGVMLKWAKGGYDGYGVYLLRENHWLDEQKKQQGMDFIKACFDNGNMLYGEELVDFEKEFALVTTRSKSGEIVFYPLVETVQQDGICRVVRSLDKETSLNTLAQEASRKICEHIGFVGTYAIEFFKTKDGLLVNELAPRVHNSGHCTLDSAQTSQFKNHILAVTDNQLGSTESAKHYAMVNILGPLNHLGAMESPNFSENFVQLYWYDKKHSKPGRKMGHLNIQASSEMELDQRINECLKKLKHWENQFV